MRITTPHWPLPKEYEDVYDLVLAEWGDAFARQFSHEMAHLLPTPYAALFAAYDDKKLCGITVASKSEVDFDWWDITWVLVANDYRGKGLGQALVKEAESYIYLDRHNYPCEKVIVQLTASIPAYYEKQGYQKVFSYNKKHLMCKVLWDGEDNQT